MGFFDMLRGADINQGVEEFKQTPGAVLLDVRSPEEYRSGHIPGSTNLPLNDIRMVQNRFPRKDTPFFVHCLSGSRSGQAVQFLKQLGYTNVKNIGGINRYRGKVEV